MTIANTIKANQSFLQMQSISEDRKNAQKIIMLLDSVRGEINYINHYFAIAPEELVQKKTIIPADLNESKIYAARLFASPVEYTEGKTIINNFKVAYENLIASYFSNLEIMKQGVLEGYDNAINEKNFFRKADELTTYSMMSEKKGH
ncbi:hypothetical protein HWQ17_10960 [Enterobacter pasteurii]|uniref:hypothetical protein n=1 Tax=Enterobacter pasteurii TaxID=3029761 RepID=UPI0011DDD76E|nr:hypothetical protein [Enterobacter pasteurii]QLA68125.1 hypothetical protein HWQ17_10960 [Enterobacter pasteurii]